jgi:hypothetical protein
MLFANELVLALFAFPVRRSYFESPSIISSHCSLWDATTISTGAIKFACLSVRSLLFKTPLKIAKIKSSLNWLELASFKSLNYAVMKVTGTDTDSIARSIESGRLVVIQVPAKVTEIAHFKCWGGLGTAVIQVRLSSTIHP